MYVTHVCDACMFSVFGDCSRVTFETSSLNKEMFKFNTFITAVFFLFLIKPQTIYGQIHDEYSRVVV